MEWLILLIALGFVISRLKSIRIDFASKDKSEPPDSKELARMYKTVPLGWLGTSNAAANPHLAKHIGQNLADTPEPMEEKAEGAIQKTELVETFASAAKSDPIGSPAMAQFFEDVANKNGQLRALVARYRMAAVDVLAWCWQDWDHFAFIAGGFLVVGGIALAVSAYRTAEIFFAIGIALFVAKGIHDLWAKKHRKEIAVILCIGGIIVIVGQGALIEWNRPMSNAATVSSAPKEIIGGTDTDAKAIDNKAKPASSILPTPTPTPTLQSSPIAARPKGVNPKNKQRQQAIRDLHSQEP
jgi:uncharacterized membrane protein YgdD (TMEM256/DUF423 family)